LLVGGAAQVAPRGQVGLRVLGARPGDVVDRHPLRAQRELLVLLRGLVGGVRGSFGGQRGAGGARGTVELEGERVVLAPLGGRGDGGRFRPSGGVGPRPGLDAGEPTGGVEGTDAVGGARGADHGPASGRGALLGPLGRRLVRVLGTLTQRAAARQPRAGRRRDGTRGGGGGRRRRGSRGHRRAPCGGGGRGGADGGRGAGGRGGRGRRGGARGRRGRRARRGGRRQC